MVHIEGIEELRHLLNKLPDAVKRRKMLSVLRKAAKPIMNAESRAAQILLNPEHKTFVHKQKGKTALPLTISRGVKIITGKNKEFPTVIIGPKYKKGAIDDPWFAVFLQGTKNRGKKGKIRTGEYDYTAAGRALAPLAAKKTVEEMGKLLKRELKKHGNR
jgi:hypothetical protein